MRFEKLTRANIRTLPIGKALREHGIVFIKTGPDDGIFEINVMVNRRRIHRSVGKISEGVTREQVETVIEKLKTEAREKRLRLPKGRKVALLFEAAAQDYLDRIKETDDYKNKKQRLEYHLIPFFKGRELESLVDWDVERYKSARTKEKVLKRDRPVTNATINRELSVLSHMLRRAERWGWIDKVPCQIAKLEETGKRDTILTRDEIKALLDAAYSHKNKQLFPFVYIGLNTSMRTSEILSIRAEHVFEDHIVIPRAKAGTRKQPITQELYTYLKTLPPEGWLFPCQGRRKSRSGHTGDLRKPFQEAVTSAGLNGQGIVRHTMRHTAISHLVMAGVDLPTVQQISGHKTFKVLVDSYAHRTPEHVKKALAQLHMNYTEEKSPTLEKLAPGGT